ncbi:TonB family protein [Novosphingobium cyanobacteriorum]|uniref:TonB family protein n=1 Tax=Novosphingobium cyanobacteriorum TaxID=3024215 RepID=A0ABT6CLL8_9SPHN|nr:TonB family protein [Novosphingobium cyanobacteriorum]MDF8334128.1 TonB family protein [Novosphingobium cyanobacteriorum]
MQKHIRLVWPAIAGVALVAADAARAAEPTAPVPASNPGFWVTTEDYPARALREEREGVVRFALTVSAEGTPTGCEIVQSTGSPDLDTQSCALIMERARFTPATDKKGRPVEGTYRSSVRWVIPRTAEPPKAGTLEFSFIVQPDGSMTDCKVVRMEGEATEEMKRKADGDGPCDKPASYDPYRDANGQPVARRVKVMFSTVVEAP